MDVNILVGRFQPVTIAHERMFLKLKEFDGIPLVFIVEGVETSKNRNLNPLTGLERKKLISEFGVRVDVISSLNEIEDILFIQNFRPKYWLAGSDRILGYEKFKSKIRYFADCNMVEMTRTDQVSATSIRNFAREDRFDEFKSMIPIRLEKHLPFLWETIRSRNDNTTESIKN